MYMLDANDFRWEFDLRVLEEDLDSPLNATLDMSLSSRGFTARCVRLDIDVYELAKFASSLDVLYESLDGEAELEDAYGTTRITFVAQERGHIGVSGRIRSREKRGHALVFENEFDQTFLRAFTKSLSRDVGKYLSLGE